MLALLLLAEGILILYGIILILIALRIQWKHRTWTARTVFRAVKDKLEDLRERRWAARKARRARKKERAEKV